MKTILLPVLIFLVLGAAMGILLAAASRIFAVKKDERAEEILACLPGANCGGCGYTGCAAYAKAVSEGSAPANACTVGGAEAAQKIGAIMGVEVGSMEKMRAQVMCSGTSEFAKKKYIYEGVPDCVAASKIGGSDKICPNGCIGLGTCVAACPVQAIQVEKGVAAVDYSKCIGCGVCTHVCPRGIIQLIPFGAKHWVGCKSEDLGKNVRKYCDVGCIACKLCVKNCPENAIAIENNLAVIDYSKCTGCDKCVSKCPRKIIWSGETQGKLGLVIARIPEEALNIDA